MRKDIVSPPDPKLGGTQKRGFGVLNEEIRTLGEEAAQHPGRLLRVAAGPDLETVVRRRQTKVATEDVAHGVVAVLAGVHQ